MRWLWLTLAIVLLAGPVRAGESETEDQPAADSVEDARGPILRAFGRPERKEPLLKGLSEWLQQYPPFIADTELLVHYRTYYRNKKRVIPLDSEAWAMGGWIGFRTGKLFDLLSAELKAFGTLPVYAPDDLDGTQLLRPGQRGFGVLGVANASLTWKELELRVGRTVLTVPYVNKNDSRMIPNTFEAVTLMDRVGTLTGGIGYIRTIKPRDRSEFVALSERLFDVETGERLDEERGMASGGIYWRPREDFYVGGVEHFAIDTFNTLYLEGGFVLPLGGELAAKLEMQFSDQRSVGQELIGSFDTQNYGIRASGSAFGAIVKLGYSQTATGAAVISPYGSNPSYVSLMQRNFVRAGEKAFLAGFSWDLARVGIPHVSGFVNYVEAWDASLLGVDLPRSREIDGTLDYRIQEGPMRGFWFRARGSWLGVQDERSSGYDVRLIINYELPLL